MPLSANSDNDAVKIAGKELIQRIERVMDDIDWSSFLKLANMIPAGKRTFVTGAGRSGLVARMFGMRLMHAGLTAYIPGETITPAAGVGDIMVAISCTGQTGYTSYLVKRAKEFGAKVVIITSKPDSPLASHADHLVTIPAKAEDIVLRAAVFEHVTSLCLDAVFNVLSERFKIDIAAFQRRHANLE
ncbi:MAG TPA: SIS domain-containing protein [Phycisphaerae bacterium]|nr:SIS domain-containing protein [Phycisphaerae bacterium]HPS53529.1 SIS domain-containing protein [Phycisphaerae bacterium]